MADARDTGRMLGIVEQAQVLKTFNAALIEAVVEEHLRSLG